jgi:hypothetical protein
MLEATSILPPYRQAAPRGSWPPPLGAIILGDGRSEQGLRYQMRPALERAPWCPPCLIVSPASATPAILSALHALRGHPAYLNEPADAADLGLLAAGAVRQRPMPAGGDLAAYVIRRTGRHGLHRLLSYLLSAATEPGAVRIGPERTVRDRMRRFGQFSPRCWRTVGKLARIAARNGESSVEVMAWHAGIEPRTLRGWSARYLGTGLHEFRERVGWEWVLEAALRTAEYVTPSADAAIRLAPSLQAVGRAAIPSTLRVGVTWRRSRAGRPPRSAAPGTASERPTGPTGQHPALVDD